VEGHIFETARIDELTRESGWSPIRQRFDVRAFGVNAWTARDAGSAVIDEHNEQPSGHEELYLVTAGRATFTVQGERIDAGAGTLVFVRDPAATRGALAEEPGTTVLVIGARPGAAFRPRSWETNAEVVVLLDNGENAEAKRVLTEALALGAYEDSAGLLYNLACAETLLGETDPALGHLRDALAERPSFAEDARRDDDLAALRDDPRFAEITADH
jgi:tetratricopeptide (TPR) repeat protein